MLEFIITMEKDAGEVFFIILLPVMEYNYAETISHGAFLFGHSFM